LLSVYHPAIFFALIVTVRRHAIGCRKIGVEFDGMIKGRQRLRITFPGPLIEAPQPAQIIVLGIQAFRRLAFGSVDLCPFQLWADGTHDAGCNLILEIKDVVHSAIEPIRPQMYPS